MGEHLHRFPSPRTIGATTAIAAFAATISALANPATIRIDGKPVAFDVPPVTTGAAAYLPLREMAARLGARLSVDATSGEIDVIHGRSRTTMSAGSTTMTVNGEKMVLADPPFAVRGRTMVSLAAISLALGTSVDFEPGHQSIDVMTPGISVPGIDAAQ